MEVGDWDYELALVLRFGIRIMGCRLELGIVNWSWLIGDSGWIGIVSWGLGNGVGDW